MSGTRHEHRTTIERWLLAGAPDAETPELESAWASLLRELPDESPSPAFAARVMLLAAGLRRPARDLSPRLRWAIGACLAMVGVFALALPALLLAFPLPVAGAIDLFADAVKLGATWTAGGVAVWQLLAAVVRPLAVVVSTPPAIAFLLAIALVSAAALRWLFELTRKDRRTADAAAR
jgi:hypothetical protein